ncbi:hypothetical protein FGU65_00765 [Methanoculleus sp. FWC-SCC1]|uniref:KaiC-like domain-containing protein n=1 Tax=Methanoculleus frigidifontis TaxID=2584085 RepID=A0ABT8M683_9EURY|nr:hypothetical protein [Methanoculleus sp. FWC-SCC1]MDN7023445.1 hypothetical protein [Methanoculleus sp. FWC-SCC1]
MSVNQIRLDDGEKRIVLALSSATRIKENNIALVREVTGQGITIIYVGANMPSRYLTDLFAKRDVDISRVAFIDCITKYAVGSVPDVPGNTRFISHPGNFTDLGIAITEMLKKYSGEDVLIFIDSINAMLIHASSDSLIKFIHFLTSKLRLMEVRGIILAVETGLDPVLFSHLTSFTDEVLTIGDDVQA